MVKETYTVYTFNAMFCVCKRYTLDFMLPLAVFTLQSQGQGCQHINDYLY